MNLVLNGALELDYEDGAGSLVLSWIHKDTIDEEVTFLLKDGRRLTLFSDGVYQVFDAEGEFIKQDSDILLKLI